MIKCNRNLHFFIFLSMEKGFYRCKLNNSEQQSTKKIQSNLIQPTGMTIKISEMT